MVRSKYSNPFRPGAGHMPPYLAGRDEEFREFSRLLEQDVVLENLVVTGLRGVGKTVLLDKLKPRAMKKGWLWVGTDLSETTSLSEENIAIRMMADLSVVTSTIPVAEYEVPTFGFHPAEKKTQRLDYETMTYLFEQTPGLTSDKLKAVLEVAWEALECLEIPGLIFAYDEAQNMDDHSAKEEYPLSLMLDVFQSIQKRGAKMMLLLCGLPTLFPKLVEARTFSERMFRVMFLDRLNEQQSRDAIVKPVEQLPVKMSEQSVAVTIKESGGYPYFIQFFCREVYDVFLRNMGKEVAVPFTEIIRKLDTDFFAGRWAKATDRQRDLLQIIATLPTCEKEFTIQEVVRASAKGASKPFSASQVSQMLNKLAEVGLVYKNRHGKHAFAVPLLGEFILRQMK